MPLFVYLRLVSGTLLASIAIAQTQHLQLPAYARQTWDTESGLPQNSVHTIAQTPDGYMWFGTEGGLARFNSSRFTVFNTKNTARLRSNDIRSLWADGRRLWVATADGVALFEDGEFKPPFGTTQGLPSNNVTLVNRGPAGAPCVTTAAGPACFIQGRFSQASAAAPAPPAIDSTLQPLVNSPVLCSFTDREGNIWIGTESTGVTICRNLEFRTYADKADHLDDLVRCVFRDRQNTIWIGTNSQGLLHYRDNRFTRLTAADGLSSNVIVSLGQDAAGDLYVGTPDGLNKIHDGTISVTTSFDGLPDDFIRSIEAQPDGVLWIGTRRGVSRFHAGHFDNFTHADGLGSDLAGSMATDARGNLWIATLQGLSRFSSGRFTNFTTTQGLTNNVVTALYEDAAGTLWIGTQGGGLNRFGQGRIQHFPASLRLPDVIDGITEDSSHNLWLASDAGIFRVKRSALDDYALDPHSPLNADIPEVVSYDTSDGLRVNECSGGGHPAIATLADGSIWFATRKGVSVLRPGVHLNRIAPLVAVESVTIDDETVPATKVADVPPGRSRIAFAYTALSFTAPQKVRFKFRLEGFDKDWVDAGPARTAYYTNLGPARYQFRVLARNEDGVWSDHPAVVDLWLAPRFYQTWWFAALEVVALCLFIYGIYRWRVAQVEAQFTAVLQERNRIAREIHDTLAQGFAGISVQLELVSRKLASSSEAAREHLDQARMLVRSSLAEARRSIWELRSQSADMEDLAARLAKMANQMGGNTPGRITLQVRGTYRPLGSKIEDELLRIAQEAVTNALRHADANRIDIELAFDPKLLHMTISDDGRGFLPGQKTTGINGHFGLQGMRERAQQIGAAFDVRTAPGQGTKISIEAHVQ